jgi:hypothetical protein
LVYLLYLLTYLLTYWALLEEPPIVQPLKNFPAFYGTRRFNTEFTRALHCSLSWAISIQSTPSHPISLRSIFLLACPPISYMHSSSPPFVLHAPPISSFLTLLFKLYSEKSTTYEVPHYAVFSYLLYFNFNFSKRNPARAASRSVPHSPFWRLWLRLAGSISVCYETVITVCDMTLTQVCRPLHALVPDSTNYTQAVASL